MGVASPAFHIIAQGMQHVEVPSGPSARDVKQPALLLNLISVAGGHVAGKDSVGNVDHVYHIPFASFGRMDGAHGEPVVILRGRSC